MIERDNFDMTKRYNMRFLSLVELDGSISQIIINKIKYA